MEEPLKRGELVTLRQFSSVSQPLGRVLSLTPAGDRAEVAWTKRPGHEHAVTLEPTEVLRRVHESEMDPAEDRRRG